MWLCSFVFGECDYVFTISIRFLQMLLPIKWESIQESSIPCFSAGYDKLGFDELPSLLPLEKSKNKTSFAEK